MAAKQNKPQLTISLLISNRPDSIRQCLDSLHPIMEQIPCELILVDTSKNPEINKVLWEYTDKVYEFDWCDDFSKARNVGLKKATGEWFLFLDDDEWFVEIDDLVNFFRSGEYKNYGYAHYQVRNFYDPSYTYYSDSWVSRMIRIDEDTEFRSKIHEYMYPVRGEYKYIYSMVYHSGYIFATEEKKRAHFERNSKLLLKMIEEEPRNLRWKIQMAQEYRSVKEYELLHGFCEKCLDEMKDMNSSNDSIHLGTFYVVYLESYMLRKMYKEAKEVCVRALEDKRNTKLCRAFVELALAEIAFREEDWVEAERRINIYFQLKEEIEKKKNALEEMSRALVVQEAFDEMSIKKANSILIACDLKLRNSTALLEKLYDTLEWDKDVIYAFVGVECVLIWAMATMEFQPLFVKIIYDAYRNQTLREYICKAAQAWSQKTEAYEKLMYIFAQVDIDDWYIWYARMIDADSRSAGLDMNHAIKKFFDAAENIFSVPEKVYDFAKKYGVDVAEIWLEIAPDRWKEYAKNYVRKEKREQIAQAKCRVDEYLEKSHWKHRYFSLTAMEAEIAEGPRDLMNIEAYVQLLNIYVEQILAFYGEYYQEYVFMQAPSVLPEEAQAAMEFLAFSEKEKNDTKVALEHLKEAAVKYPFFSEGIKKFIQLYPTLEKQRERKQKEEMNALKKQVLLQVENMMAHAQVNDALAILKQLQTMMPNDLDVAEAVLKARLTSLEPQD